MLFEAKVRIQILSLHFSLYSPSFASSDRRSYCRNRARRRRKFRVPNNTERRSRATGPAAEIKELRRAAERGVRLQMARNRRSFQVDRTYKRGDSRGRSGNAKSWNETWARRGIGGRRDGVARKRAGGEEGRKGAQTRGNERRNN